uniref:Uncharacterized protein n=1 Tax=Oryza glumipatula TaxID=40148 RepID=A0A0E0B7W4_9ORYZ
MATVRSLLEEGAAGDGDGSGEQGKQQGAGPAFAYASRGLRRCRSPSYRTFLSSPAGAPPVLLPSLSHQLSSFSAMTKIVGMLGPKLRSVDTISSCLKASMSVVPWSGGLLPRLLPT